MPFLLLLLVFALLIEATVTTLPIVLLVLLVFVVVFRSFAIFTLAFFSGLLIDLFALRPLGQTSLFFTMFFLLIFLYERKYEIATFPFVLFSSFFGGLIYAALFGYEHPLLLAVFSTLVAALLFKAMRLFVKPHVKT